MAYSRKRKARKPKNTTKKRRPGLNKVEKKQVKSIAKSTVNKLAETKYFNVASMNRITAAAAWNIIGDQSDVAVYGYSTGKNRQTTLSGASSIMKYGQSTVDGSDISLTNLNMNRIFLKDEGPDEKLRAFCIEGQTLRPSFNECKWYMNYVAQNTDANPQAGLPYRLRIVKVSPRALKGSFQPVDPEQDLFLDQNNQPFGIQTGVVGGTPKFTREQFHLAKVNSRRYHVSMDKFCIIHPSSTYNTNGTEFGDVTMVTSLANKGFFEMTTKHKIGTELFYPKGATGGEVNDSYPDTGFEPEYVFIHAIALGDDNVTSAQRVTPLGMLVTARPVSTFKDI